MKKRFKGVIALLLLASCLLMAGCSQLEQLQQLLPPISKISLEEVPEYDGKPYVVINGNVPEFSEEDYFSGSYEYYGALDYLGRCTYAMASIGIDLMPVEERQSIGMVKPSGWQISKYDFIDGKYLYNRCHLIGFQLTGENANDYNLITGTRYMNTDGMLPFENKVANYIKKTGENVLYRVTPVFDGTDLVCRGVHMEASSVNDYGRSLQFNVFVYNVQPGVEIDYSNGDNWLDEGEADSDTSSGSKDSEDAVLEIRGNKRSKIYHCPGQRAYEQMGTSNNLIVFSSEEEAQAAGYRKAQQ